MPPLQCTENGHAMPCASTCDKLPCAASHPNALKATCKFEKQVTRMLQLQHLNALRDSAALITSHSNPYTKTANPNAYAAGMMHSTDVDAGMHFACIYLLTFLFFCDILLFVFTPRTSSMLLETALFPMLALILVRNLRPGCWLAGQHQEDVHTSSKPPYSVATHDLAALAAPHVEAPSTACIHCWMLTASCEAVILHVICTSCVHMQQPHADCQTMQTRSASALSCFSVREACMQDRRTG